MNIPRIHIVVSDNHSPLKGKEWLASNGARNVQDEPGHLLFKKKTKNKPKTNKQKNKQGSSIKDYYSHIQIRWECTDFLDYCLYLCK